MSLFSFDKKLIPLDDWVQDFVDWLVFNHRDIFQAIKTPIELCLKGFEWFFTFLHPAVVIVLFALAAWRFAGKRVTLFTVATFLLVGYLGLWEDTMITLAMVISSVFFSPDGGTSFPLLLRKLTVPPRIPDINAATGR